MTRFLLALTALGLAAASPRLASADPLSDLEQQCAQDSQDANVGGMPQSCLEYQKLKDAKTSPASAGPSLQECAYKARADGLIGLSKECRDVLTKARDSGELQKAGGLEALARGYQPPAAPPDQKAAAPKPDAPVDAEFQSLPAAQGHELTSLKNLCDFQQQTQADTGSAFASTDSCDQLAKKKEEAFKKLDKDCEAYKDMDAGQMDTPDAQAMKKACVNRGDQKLGLDPKKLATPEQCRDALSALNNGPAAADAKDKGARLSDICGPVAADMLKNWDHKSELPGAALAVFQWDCAKHPDHTAMCLAVGIKKNLPQSLGPAGSDTDAVVKTFFHGDQKMKAYFDQNPDKLKSFNDAYAKCKSQAGRAGDDCMVELQRNWLSANPGTAYAAIPDKFYKKAPGKRDLLQAIIDRQGWDDQMRQRFQGNLDKMSPRQFESNYAGVLDGHPRTAAGRQYLVNACKGLPDGSPQEALSVSELRGICGRFNAAQARRERTVPPPVMTPEKPLTHSVADSIRGALRPSPVRAPLPPGRVPSQMVQSVKRIDVSRLPDGPQKQALVQAIAGCGTEGFILTRINDNCEQAWSLYRSLAAGR